MSVLASSTLSGCRLATDATSKLDSPPFSRILPEGNSGQCSS